MSLNSTISRQKYNRACGCQGVEEPISLIMRSWDFTKRANVAGCETKLWKYSGAARIILWQCNLNLPAIGNCLIQTETYRRWTELSCCRGCRLLPEKKLEAEWYTGHGAAVLIKQHRSTTTQGQWLVFGKAFENHSNSYHFPRASPAWTKRTIAPRPQMTLHETGEQCCRWLKHYHLKIKVSICALEVDFGTSWDVARRRDISMESKATDNWP